MLKLKRKNRIKDTAREKLSPFTVILLVVLVLYVVSLLIPMIWAFLTAFKHPLNDFRTNIIGLPRKWIWNIGAVFEKFTYPIQTARGTENVSMLMMYLYSFLYAFGCAFFNTLVPCITAYMCARFPFKFSKVIHTTVIVVMVMPIVGSLPSEIHMARMFGLYDRIWGLWIMKANFLGMYFLVFYNMFRSLPMGYTEAAKVDGAGNLRILLQVVMPLVRNTFFTVMLINFITFWNDYQTPLAYLPSYPTIALGMYRMMSYTENSMSTPPMRMAGAIMMLVPIMIVFLVFHKRLLGNLTMGGLKG